MATKAQTRFPCERCGEEQEALDVTTFHDTKKRYVIGWPCQCPGPRCPFCTKRMTSDQCDNLACFMVGKIIPLPEVY